MTQKLSDTPQNVLDFVERVRGVVEQAQNQPIEDDIIDDLQTQYRTLYDEYQNNQFNGLSDETILLLEHLHFGLNARLQVQGPLLQAIGKSTDTQFTHTFLQEYIKSAAGYDSVHKNKRTKEQKTFLMEAFGGVLGVQITEEFVKSVKAEQMMDVILYVASGLQAKDVAAYRKQSPQTLSIDMYLLNKMQEQKHEAIYHLDNAQQSSGRSYVAGHVYPLNQAARRSYRVAGRGRSDSCFVNHDTKQIHIGLATSLAGLGASAQAEVICKFKDALEKTRDAMEGQDGFAFEGYTIHTHLLHGGLLPLENLEPQQELLQRKGVGFEMMKELGYDSEKWTDANRQEAIDVLAGFPILAYTNEKNPHNKVMRGLLASNMASLGTDTQDFYDFCNELRRKMESQNKNEKITQEQAMTALAEKTLDYTDRMLDFFNQPHVNIHINSNGKLKTLVNTVVQSLNNHTLNFPPRALGGDTYSNEHIERLRNTAKKMSAFYTKIETDHDVEFGKLLRDIQNVANHYETRAILEKTRTGKPVEIHFDPIKYQQLNQKVAKSRQVLVRDQFKNDVGLLFRQGNTRLFALLEEHVQKQNSIQVARQFLKAVNTLRAEQSASPVLNAYPDLNNMGVCLTSFFRKKRPTFHEEIWQDVLQSTKSYLTSSNRANMGKHMADSNHYRHYDLQRFADCVTTHFPPSQYEAFYDDVHALAQTCQLVSDQKSVSGTKKVKMK